MRGRFAVAGLVALALVAPSFVAPTTHAQAAATWLAGSDAQKLTPPLYNPAHDARDFPGCDTSVFTGHRIFDFEEPYIDNAHTGFFDYTKDPYCDLGNHNGRYDGLYSSGGVDHLLSWIHDDIWARALAVSDGATTVVIESITSQGLLLEDMNRIRTTVKTAKPQVTQVFISSDHNESSPDPIGIYGAPDNGTGSAGVHSGVDDYYITYLVQQAALAAENAVGSMAAAQMRVADFTPSDVRARLSETFLTTDAIHTPPTGTPPFGTPEATDTKARVVQLVRADNGVNIETVFNWAAHNQQVGHADSKSVAPDPNDAGHALKPINRSVSDDWPGVFSTNLEALLGSGKAMFLVGDNGSIEDPHANPVPNPDNECPASDFTDNQPRNEGCMTLARYTGTHLAADVLGVVQGQMDDVPLHAIHQMTNQFFVPLQNQLFIAAFGAGLFAHRTVATVQPCIDSNNVSRTCFQTEVGGVDFGPQLEMLVNPGEAYPALIQGHPFGIEQMSCPARPEPPVPAWHAHATHKLQVGLGDDLIGYEVPGPGWYAASGVYADPNCPAGTQPQDPTSGYDQYNQYHKLESESVGPDGGELVPQHLAALADALPDPPGNFIQNGRFLRSDGSYTRKGADVPVGMWVLPNGTTNFTPGAGKVGTLVALPGIATFGTTAVDLTGQFMDYDGQAQPNGADIDTRGMIVTSGGATVARYFMDPYAVLTGSPPGAASGPVQVPEFPPGGLLLLSLFLLGTVPASRALGRRAQRFGSRPGR